MVEPLSKVSVDTTVDKSELLNLLKGVNYFKGVPESVLSKLLVDTELRYAKADETIFTIGQYDGYEVLAFVKGEAQLTCISPKSGDMHIEKVHPYECIGLDHLLCDELGLVSQMGLLAISDVQYIALDAQIIQETLENSDVFTRAFLSNYARKIVQQKFIINAPANDSTRRVMAVLLELATPDPSEANSWIIEKMPKHRELCEKAGVTEEVSAELVALLISDGIVQRQYPGLMIKDYTRFHAMAT